MSEEGVARRPNSLHVGEGYSEGAAMRIGIADDDETTGEFVSQVLEGRGHSCSRFRNSGDLLAALQRDTFDLLILDWNMPDMTGLDLIRWGKENIIAFPPAIMLTNRQDNEDVARALDTGADDYIVKPESAIVIAARVDAVLRRTSARPSTERIEVFGPYSFDRIEEHVAFEGETVGLTTKEFALAYAFFTNQNRPLSRRYLMENVWRSTAELTTRTLDMHVSKIRSKLKLSSGTGYRLQTVFGYGYRLEKL